MIEFMFKIKIHTIYNFSLGGSIFKKCIQLCCFNEDFDVKDMLWFMLVLVNVTLCSVEKMDDVVLDFF